MGRAVEGSEGALSPSILPPRGPRATSIIAWALPLRYYVPVLLCPAQVPRQGAEVPHLSEALSSALALRIAKVESEQRPIGAPRTRRPKESTNAGASCGAWRTASTEKSSAPRPRAGRQALPGAVITALDEIGLVEPLFPLRRGSDDPPTA